MGTPQVSPGYPTASLAAQASAAWNFKRQQELFAAMAIADILSIWMQMNLSDVRASWPALRIALASLIRDRFGTSAAMGNAYYLQARLASGVTGEFPIATAPLPDDALIAATLDSTGPWGLLARIKAAQPVDQAMQNTGVILSGAASRLILNGARTAVLQAVGQDDKAVAWMRVTAADPCAFCAMLASLGAHYKTEQSASFQAHSHCRCVAQPCFSVADAEALRDNDLYDQWKRVTKGLGGKDALNAWRRYWNAQHPDAIGVPVAA